MRNRSTELTESGRDWPEMVEIHPRQDPITSDLSEEEIYEDQINAAAKSRIVIEGIEPEVDGGLYPCKLSVGEELTVEADIFCEGHDVLVAVLKYRRPPASEWCETSMSAKVNDRWSGRFLLSDPGWNEYTVEAWVDPFASWHHEFCKRNETDPDLVSELKVGEQMIREIARRARGVDRDWLEAKAEVLGADDRAASWQVIKDPALSTIAERYPDRSRAVCYEKILRVWADRPRARFGAWYELFPRSTSPTPNQHGTLRDLERRLSYVASMGFDVLYLPPIHPIGRSFRKGPNNTLHAKPTDPGSPWAIGSDEGGHKSIDSRLGNFADFEHLLAAANDHGIEIAMDIALQCSPDHPYVSEHPEWFRRRPDGSIKYAENPPKKYQDIYPFDFECDEWRALWLELRSIVLFWAERGVRIFRVDNPHTKPFRFWQWLIATVQQRFPDAFFLAEAFTRPKVMRFLAKAGFAQSYSYFTWRNTKYELTSYFRELTQTSVRHFMRPNLFVNTPDILPEYLQHSGRAGFQIRLILAATLGATYGIYGPPFETFQATPRPGVEEYIDSEKYQIAQWEFDAPNVFREFIALVNQIRRENPALHFDHRLRFHKVENEQLLFYSKTTPDLSNIVMVIANLDPHHTQSGYVHVPLDELEFDENDSYQVHDLLTGAHFIWRGRKNYVSLDPSSASAHILRVRRKIRTERDFDYFM